MADGPGKGKATAFGEAARPAAQGGQLLLLGCRGRRGCWGRALSGSAVFAGEGAGVVLSNRWLPPTKRAKVSRGKTGRRRPRTRRISV